MGAENTQAVERNLTSSVYLCWRCLSFLYCYSRLHGWLAVSSSYWEATCTRIALSGD